MKVFRKPRKGQNRRELRRIKARQRFEWMALNA